MTQKRAGMKHLREEDRDFVREELAWIADTIKKKYPDWNYGEINREIREILSVSV